jgi:hypothetical protein
LSRPQHADERQDEPDDFEHRILMDRNILSFMHHAQNEYYKHHNNDVFNARYRHTVDGRLDWREEEIKQRKAIDDSFDQRMSARHSHLRMV